MANDDRQVTHQDGPFIGRATSRERIQLELGQPSPRLLPMAAIAEAASTHLRADTDPLLLQYGVRSGYEAFRVALATFLAREYGQAVEANELAVTGGTSLALALVTQMLGRPGRPVVSGDPTYFLAARVFNTQGLDVTGIPVDEHGLDVAELERRLDKGLTPSFVYCIPAFHNPTGVTLVAERARRLVELADRHDFIVVADEPYPLLSFDGPRGSLTVHDEGRGRVLSLGTMSKILGPGLRLGWMHGAPALIKRMMRHGALVSGGCVNPVMARVVEGVIDSGFLARHVVTLRETFHERAQVMAAALSEELDREISRPDGGYFAWTDLGRGVDTKVINERAKEHLVSFTPGAWCSVDRDLSSFLRVSFAFYEADELELGVRRLGRAIRGEAAAG